ncbi:MATE family efflux transporter [bacterium]|nr:MATE family efflux transporter [bacterium]
MEKEHKLADKNIPKLLFSLTLPATVGMLVMALYNIVDTMFIGHGVGPNGIAGLSIVFPIQLIVLGFGQMFGMGGASIISRALGAKDYDKANLTFGNQIFSVLLFTVLIMLPGLLFPRQILTLFGATEAILPYSLSYYRIIVYGTGLFMFAMMSNNVLRAEGHAKIAMSNMMISAGLNIILDPIFIFWFDMGIQGAALATVISQGLVVFYLIYHFTKGKSYFRIKLRNIRPNFILQKEMFTIGLAAFVRQVAGSFIVVIINNKLGSFNLAEVYIAVYGIINRLLSLFFMPMFGIGQGLQPVLGYNWGAKRLDLAKKAVRLAFTWATLISIFAFIVIQLFPSFLISWFTTDAQVIKEGAYAIRRITILFPVLGFQIIGSIIFQALGHATESLILSLSRQILFFIPIFYVMSHYYGFLGVLLTFPMADILAFSVTFFMLQREFKKWKVA